MTDTLPSFDLPENVQSDEQLAAQQHSIKMFSITEKIIMNYIAQYFKMPVEEVFIDDNPEPAEAEKITYFPIKAYSPTKFITISLEIVDADYSYGLMDPNSLGQYPEIREGVEYIITCMNEVFAVLTRHCLRPEIPMETESFHLIFEQETGTFLPLYLTPDHRKFVGFSQILKILDDFKKPNEFGVIKYDELSEEEKSQMAQQTAHLLHLLNDMELDEADIKEQEDARNQEMRKMPRIGIVISEVSWAELPEMFRDKVPNPEL